MMHEVLPDRLVMYVNQAHNIYIKMSLKSELGAIYRLQIQYLGFSG